MIEWEITEKEHMPDRKKNTGDRVLRGTVVLVTSQSHFYIALFSSPPAGNCC